MNLDGQAFSGVEALCGDEFFDALIMNIQKCANTYLNYQAAAELRTGYAQAGLIWGSFVFGGILWTNYRGYVAGAPMIEPDGRTSIRPASRTCSPPCTRRPTISRRSTRWANPVRQTMDDAQRQGRAHGHADESTQLGYEAACADARHYLVA